MDIDKDAISKALTEASCRVRVIWRMYESFYYKRYNRNSESGLRSRLRSIERIFDENTCKHFDNWFTNLGREDISFHEFKSLLISRDFKLLSFYLHDHEACYLHYKISLESSDKVVMEMDKGVMDMDKMAATTQSQASENDKVDEMAATTQSQASENDKVDEMAATTQSQASENDEVDEMAATTQSQESENDKVDELKSFAEVMEMAATTISQVLRDEIDYSDSLDGISLKSSDNVVMRMDKMAATTQSVVLGEITGGLGEITLPIVSSTFLPSIISFCLKNHIFHEYLDIVVKLLKSFYKSYKDWLTRFLRSNNPILSHLHEGADYLEIRSLLELTSLAMGDMNENTDEEISEWYGTLSISRILSPLGFIVEAF